MYNINGPQSKISSSSSSSSSRRSCSESRKGTHKDRQQNVIRNQVTSKLNDIQSELKDDINKSVARLLKAAKQAAPAGHPARALNNKLQKEVFRCNHAASQRRLIASEPKLLVRASNRMRPQKSFVDAKADWTTLKSSLRRSFSHSQASQDANKIEIVANSRLMDTKRHLQNDISCQFNRCGSWLSNLHRQSSLSATLFILATFVLMSSTVQGAAIVVPASTQPVWLDDESLGTGGNLASAEDSAALVFDNDEVYPRADLSRLQRRRLERERALEPPPWLREQPMRRGSSPVRPDEEEDVDSNEQLQQVLDREPLEQNPEVIEQADEAPSEWTKPNLALGRQSRQSSDQVYGELLRHLFEEAINGRAILDDLYDEVELRLKSNNQRPTGGSLLQSGGQQKLGSSKISGADSLNQREIEPEPTLVVGDQVPVDASDSLVGSMPVSTVKSSRPALNAAYMRDVLASFDGAQVDSSKAGSIGLSGSQVPKLSTESLTGAENAPSSRLNFSSAFYMVPMASSFLHQSNQDASVDSVDSDGADGEQQDFSLLDTQRTPLMGSSFHVVEDIDQAPDNGQDTALPSPSSDDQSDQQQQFIERTDLLSRDGASPVGNLRKRNTAIWTQPAQQTPAPGRQPIKFRLTPNGQPTQVPSQATADNGAQMSGEAPSVAGLVQSGRLSSEQLARLANSLKGELEDSLGLPRATIQRLHAINAEQLLVKIDTSRLSTAQMIDMIQNYDFARGYIVLTWPKEDPRNPTFLLRAISNMLISNGGARLYEQNSGGSDNLEIGEIPTDKDQLSLIDIGSAVKSGQQQVDSLILPPNGYQAALSNLFSENSAIRTVQSGLGSPLYKVDHLDDENPAPAKVVTERQLLLATLAAYLNKINSVHYKPAWRSGLAESKSAGWSSSLIPEIGGLPRVWPSLDGSASGDSPVGSRHLLHLLALGLSLLGAYLAIKLVLRFADRQLIKRHFDNISEASSSLHSFWPSKAASHSDCVVGAGEKQAPLDEANFNRRLSSSSNTDEKPFLDKAEACTKPGDRKRIELLAQKLINLLSLSGKPNRKCTSDKAAADGREEIDELAQQANANIAVEIDNEETSSGATRFRTSRSYIRSLINALTNAHSEIGPSKLKPERPAPSSSTSERSPAGRSELTEKGEGEQGVVMSQMDISAAHLILAYMEKHLEDKERLEREWLELNGAGSSKVGQLVLQRLAKVALSEENRRKNRNCLAVPYDRNRVKLSSGTQAPGKERAASRLNGGSDYINASYIHDDDLRRPTHIIAQGPSEQTIGQFWQMIWEEGVSVIVMLTRLNENSVRMCHCYWPTDASQPSPTGAECGSPPAGQVGGKQPPANWAAGKRTPSGQPVSAQVGAMNNGNGRASSANTANGAASATNGRRNSVTSVISLGGLRNNGNNQPIIANGDPGNNVLYLDLSLNYSAPLDEEPTPGDKDKVVAVEEEGERGRTHLIKKGDSKPETTKPKPANSTSLKFEIHLVSEHVSSSDYLVRNMYMINRATGETRTITQFHYLSWPEMGVPVNAKSLLQFRRKVHKSYRNLKSPILVHCSDGTGRSGTYTLIDIILERIKNGAKEIDPRATLEHLRDQRVGLCATKAQFEFVLMALAEEIQIILNALPQ